MLDLAAGTGKLTRQLAPRFARVIAVEPLDGMRDVLERVVPEAEALAGSADSIPLPDDSVDAIFVAEAFHWFATDETLREDRPRPPAARNAGDPLQPVATGDRAAVAGGLRDGLRESTRDEAAGA